MLEIRFHENEAEIAASIKYPDNSKVEFSFLKETKALSLSQYSDASSDIPDKEYTLMFVEVQALAKLFALPEMSLEVVA